MIAIKLKVDDKIIIVFISLALTVRIGRSPQEIYPRNTADLKGLLAIKFIGIIF